MLTLVVATAMSMYAAEALLYWWDRSFVQGIPVSRVEAGCPGPASTNPRCLEAVRRGMPFDSRTPLEVFNDRAAVGDTVWPAVPARAFQPGEGLEVAGGDSSPGRLVLPLAGISRVETLLCNESGRWLTYQADEHGFNNPIGTHGVDSVTVAVVGDSFVHGWCVERPQTIAGLLRTRWGTVVNLGLEGSGPLAQVGILREYGEALEPRIVLWHFFAANDTDDLGREARTPLLRRYLNPDFRQRLDTMQPDLDAGLRAHVLDLRRQDDERARDRARMLLERRVGRDNQLVAWMKLRRIRGVVRRALQEPDPGRTYAWDPELFNAVMSRARDDVAQWGGRLVFVYVPSWQRVFDPQMATPHREAILDAALTLGIPVIDPTTAFLQHPNPERLFPFGIDGHYTEEGFQLLVQQVERYLEESGADPSGDEARREGVGAPSS